MKWIRVPTRMFFVVQLGWAVLAGMGWQALGQIKGRKALPLLIWWSVLLLLVIIGAAWTHWFPEMLAVPTTSIVIALIGLPCLAIHTWTQKLRHVTPTIMVSMAVLESLALTPLFMASTLASDLTQPTPAVEFLTEQGDFGRTYSTQGLIPLTQAVSHGIETVDGYDPVQLEYYVTWLNRSSGCDLTGYSPSVPTCASPEIDQSAYLRAQPNGRLLGIGQVQYILANHALDQWPLPVWQSGSERIYENEGMLPPAFVVPQVIEESSDEAAMSLLRSSDPSTVAVVSELPGGIQMGNWQGQEAMTIRTGPNTLQVESEGPGWLVVSEIWAPGWQAALDGRPVEVYRTDVAFLGVPLPTGSHTVEFEYSPVGWAWGRWVSLGTAGFLLLTTTLVLLVSRRLIPACGRRR
jgi:hypothetical protein